MRLGLRMTSWRGRILMPSLPSALTGTRAPMHSNGMHPPSDARGYELTWLQHVATSASESASLFVRSLGRILLSCSWLRSVCDFWFESRVSQ